jgi:hypothetical protein
MRLMQLAPISMNASLIYTDLPPYTAEADQELAKLMLVDQAVARFARVDKAIVERVCCLLVDA